MIMAQEIISNEPKPDLSALMFEDNEQRQRFLDNFDEQEKETAKQVIQDIADRFSSLTKTHEAQARNAQNFTYNLVQKLIRIVGENGQNTAEAVREFEQNKFLLFQRLVCLKIEHEDLYDTMINSGFTLLHSATEGLLHAVLYDSMKSAIDRAVPAEKENHATKEKLVDATWLHDVGKSGPGQIVIPKQKISNLKIEATVFHEMFDDHPDVEGGLIFTKVAKQACQAFFDPKYFIRSEFGKEEWQNGERNWREVKILDAIEKEKSLQKEPKLQEAMQAVVEVYVAGGIFESMGHSNPKELIMGDMWDTHSATGRLVLRAKLESNKELENRLDGNLRVSIRDIYLIAINHHFLELEKILNGIDNDSIFSEDGILPADAMELDSVDKYIIEILDKYESFLDRDKQGVAHDMTIKILQGRVERKFGDKNCREYKIYMAIIGTINEWFAEEKKE